MISVVENAEMKLQQCPTVWQQPLELATCGHNKSRTMENVYTVTDYYDGPRRGVADFNGTPHAYTSVFDDSEDQWESTFLLRPVDQGTLRLVLEDWKIWERWRKAFDEGTATIESHPALPQDRQRHEQIKPILEQALKIEPTTKLRARGRFEAIDGGWKVEWIQSQ